MTSSQVIYSVPWLSALGSWLLVGSLYSVGTLSDLLGVLALAALAGSLGALLTHYPR